MRHWTIGIVLILSLLCAAPPAQAQDIAATQSQMFAAIRQVHFESDNTTGIGAINSSMPLLRVTVRNGSDHPLQIRSFTVTFRVSGEVTAWPSIDGSDSRYRMLFTVPSGSGVSMTFPISYYHVIDPHSTATLDLFADIPDAPRGTVAGATTLAQVEYVLGSVMGTMMPDIIGRNWKVQ